MFETAFTLSLTQFARNFSIPERIQRRPGRNAALEAFRLRNSGLDAMFYDVKVLTPEEVFYVSDALAAEGLIMIVPPTGGPMLTVCDSIDEYLLRGGRDVHVLAVAGIGGSALGAAAFARNVADAMGEPVAAVVSGFGLGDIVNEAIGGAFLFGWLGNFRNECEVLDDVVGRPKLGAYKERHAVALKPGKACLDVDTVEALLADEQLSFHLLAGHSKGNLVLSEALYALRKEDPGRARALGQSARIVTFGARITMPPDFQDVVDVMGGLDWYGELNSRPLIESDIKIPMAGHSTNTDLMGSLPVTAILKEITARRLPAPLETGHALVAEPVAALPLAMAQPIAEPAELVEADLPVAEPMELIGTEPQTPPIETREIAPDIETTAAVAPEPAIEHEPEEKLEQLVDQEVEPEPTAVLAAAADDVAAVTEADVVAEPPSPVAGVPPKRPFGGRSRPKAKASGRK